MKKHAIIPIFIPHLGCGHSCVFCNQRIITARDAKNDINEMLAVIEDTTEQYLSTLEGQVETVELAFYGGSFTGIPQKEQEAYLSLAKKYKDEGRIDKIHMSTRPDYIDTKIMDRLKYYTVDTVELGVQSFDPDVLRISKRGHGVDEIYRACDMIKSYGMELGIQLMAGLPGDTKAKAIESARKTAEIAPELARIYPTVVLQDTELALMFESGEYVPPTEEEMIDITKEMYKVLFDAGITIMRVGLKSTDLVTTGSDIAGEYHPAFRQIVEGEIAKERMIEEINKRKRTPEGEKSSFTFVSNAHWFNNMIGHKAQNKKYFKNLYPKYSIRYRIDDKVKDGDIILEEDL